MEPAISSTDAPRSADLAACVIPLPWSDKSHEREHRGLPPRTPACRGVLGADAANDELRRGTLAEPMTFEFCRTLAEGCEREADSALALDWPPGADPCATYPVFGYRGAAQEVGSPQGPH